MLGFGYIWVSDPDKSRPIVRYQHYSRFYSVYEVKLTVWNTIFKLPYFAHSLYVNFMFINCLKIRNVSQNIKMTP